MNHFLKSRFIENSIFSLCAFGLAIGVASSGTASEVHSISDEENDRIYSQSDRTLSLADAAKIFSARPEFRRVTGWEDASDTLRENIYEQKLEPSDLRSPETHFQRLWSKFSTEPAFRCQHPIANLYFEKYFGRNPIAISRCEPWENYDSYDLIPERVHSIQIIYVEPGSDLISRFGHLALGFNFDSISSANNPEELSDFKGMINISASLTGRTVINGNESSGDLKQKLAKIRKDGTPWATTVMAKSLIGINPLQISFQDHQSFIREKARERRQYQIHTLKLSENEKDALLVAINRAMTYSGSFNYSLLSSGCSTIITDLLGRILFMEPHISGLLPKTVFENLKQIDIQ